MLTGCPTTMRSLVVALAAVVVAACGSDATPVTPSPPPAATFTLTGRVVHAPTGTPTVGAIVSVTTGVNAGRSAQSDTEGHFTLANLQPGTFPIEVVLSLLGTVLRRDVQLTQDTTLELSWTPPPPPTFGLSGHVTDAGTGAALGGATLAIIDGVNTGRSTTTAPDGTYRFDDLTFGGFTLRVRYTGYDSEFRAVRVTAETTLDVAMRPAMQSLAGTWTGTLTYTSQTGAPVTAAIAETTMTHAGASIGSNFLDGFFSGTLRDPSAISSTTSVTGPMTVFHSEGSPRAPTACNGTATFTGTVNWTRLVLVVPRMPLACGGSIANVTLSLVKQQ